MRYPRINQTVSAEEFRILENLLVTGVQTLRPNTLTRSLERKGLVAKADAFGNFELTESGRLILEEERRT